MQVQPNTKQVGEEQRSLAPGHEVEKNLGMEDECRKEDMWEGRNQHRRMEEVMM